MGIVAWLIARGLSPLLSWLVIGGVGLAVLGGGAWFVHHQWDVHVGEPYRVEGDQRTTKKLKPQIEAAERDRDAIKDDLTKEKAEHAKTRSDLAASQSDLKVAVEGNATLVARIDGKGGLVEQLTTSKRSIEFLKNYTAQLRAANAQILARLNDSIAQSQAAVDRARAVVASPVEVDFASACREGDKFLIDLARRLHAT